MAELFFTLYISNSIPILLVLLYSIFFLYIKLKKTEIG